MVNARKIEAWDLEKGMKIKFKNEIYTVRHRCQSGTKYVAVEVDGHDGTFRTWPMDKLIEVVE